MRQLLASIASVLILVALWPQSVLPASPPFPSLLFQFNYRSEPHGAVSGDYDGDGNADLAVVLRGSDELTILISNGNGLFATGLTVPVGDGPEWIVMGDLNGDARADLVVVNNGSSDVTVLFGGSDAAFVAQPSFSTGSQPVAAILAHLDGDADLDLVVSNQGSQDLSFFFG